MSLSYLNGINAFILLPEKTVSFQHVTMGDQIFMCLFGLVIFLLTLNFLHILRFNHTIAVMAEVLAASAVDLLLMSMNIMVIVTAFASCAYTLFGPFIKGYSDLAKTLTTLSTNFLGSFDFSEISDNTGKAGEVFILLYLLIMIFIVINLFVTLLCTFLDAVRADESVIPKDHEVADHFLSVLHGFVVPDSLGKKESNKGT